MGVAVSAVEIPWPKQAVKTKWLVSCLICLSGNTLAETGR